MDDVKQTGPTKLRDLLEAGAPFVDAVRIMLADRDREAGDADAPTHAALSRFAARHGLNRSALSSAMHGGRPLPFQTAYWLAEELGGSAPDWVALHQQHARSRGAAAV